MIYKKRYRRVKFDTRKANEIENFFNLGIKIMRKRGMQRGQGFTKFPKKV